MCQSWKTRRQKPSLSAVVRMDGTAKCCYKGPRARWRQLTLAIPAPVLTTTTMCSIHPSARKRCLLAVFFAGCALLSSFTGLWPIQLPGEPAKSASHGPRSAARRRHGDGLQRNAVIVAVGSAGEDTDRGHSGVANAGVLSCTRRRHAIRGCLFRILAALAGNRLCSYSAGPTASGADCFRRRLSATNSAADSRLR